MLTCLLFQRTDHRANTTITFEVPRDTLSARKGDYGLIQETQAGLERSQIFDLASPVQVATSS